MYSHILGQIDDDNYGISGVEKYFDKDLKDLSLINQPLKLSLDTNIQSSGLPYTHSADSHTNEVAVLEGA